MGKLRLIQCANGCGKEIEAYNKNTYCVDCKKEAMQRNLRNYIKKNPEKANERYKRYREKYPERLKASQTKFHSNINNIIKRKKAQKKFKENNPASIIYQTSKYLGKKNSYTAISDYMTLKDFENWYNTQVKECAVCGTTTETLCVDHDHDSGMPCGILCQGCNISDGAIKTIENAEALVRYMKIKMDKLHNVAA